MFLRDVVAACPYCGGDIVFDAVVEPPPPHVVVKSHAYRHPRSGDNHYGPARDCRARRQSMR